MLELLYFNSDCISAYFIHSLLASFKTDSAHLYWIMVVESNSESNCFFGPNTDTDLCLVHTGHTNVQKILSQLFELITKILSQLPLWRVLEARKIVFFSDSDYSFVQNSLGWFFLTKVSWSKIGRVHCGQFALKISEIGSLLHFLWI